MKNYYILLRELENLNGEALVPDGFEDAVIGFVERAGQNPLALLDKGKCIHILETDHGMTAEEAVEYFYFNVIGSYVGDGTPCFATIF